MWKQVGAELGQAQGKLTSAELSTVSYSYINTVGPSTHLDKYICATSRLPWMLKFGKEALFI